MLISERPPGNDEKGWLTRIPLVGRTWALAARIAFAMQLARLRRERARDQRRGSRAQRVVAYACWGFPIYSQTFVYQELTQLVRAGFAVRFLYGGRDWSHRLPSQFEPLWRVRRRLVLQRSVCEHSYGHFVRAMPDRVRVLTEMVSEASGLSPDEVRRHVHFRQAFAFARMAEAYGPDYIHSYFFYEGTLYAFVASYLLGVPRGVSCYTDHMLRDYELKLLPLHLRQCRIVVATSERIRRELLSIGPDGTLASIIVKPNAINTDRFPAVERPEPADGTPFRLVCVSRIEPKKGLVFLVDAVRMLRDRGVRVEVDLIGGVDRTAASREYYRLLTRRIAELGIADVVHLQGRRSEAEINAAFRGAHLFVAPFIETESGDKDGVPTSLLEAMSSGLPIVATDAGSIGEVIDPGRNGIVVPQRDPAALAAAIERLIAGPGVRAALGREAAATVRARFDAATGEIAFHDRVRQLPRAAARGIGP